MITSDWTEEEFNAAYKEARDDEERAAVIFLWLTRTVPAEVAYHVIHSMNELIMVGGNKDYLDQKEALALAVLKRLDE